MRNHNGELLFSLPINEQSPHTDDVCVPPTPECPPPHRKQRPRPSSLLSKSGASQRPPALGAALRHHPRPRRTDDQTSVLSLATPVKSDETTPELISSLGIDSLVTRSVSSSQYSNNEIDGHSQYLKLSTHCHPSGPVQGVSVLELFGPAICSPDHLAEQFCVLMHTLYATIRRNDCLDWTVGRRGTEVTGLRRFFDMHDCVASWVQRAILTNDDITRQAETLDFWIRVAQVIGRPCFDGQLAN